MAGAVVEVEVMDGLPDGFEARRVAVCAVRLVAGTGAGVIAMVSLVLSFMAAPSLRAGVIAAVCSGPCSPMYRVPAVSSYLIIIARKVMPFRKEVVLLT